MAAPIVAAIIAAGKAGLIIGITEMAQKAITWAGDKIAGLITGDDLEQPNAAGKAVDDVLGRQSQNVIINNGQIYQGYIIINNYFPSGSNEQERNVLINIDNVNRFEKAQQYQNMVANGKGNVAVLTPQNVPSNVISLSYKTKTAQIHSNNANRIMQMSNDVASNIREIDKLDIGGEIYTIFRGDSLYKIAKENNITLNELRKANAWVEDRFSKDQKFALIYPGEKLVIPTKENLEKIVQQNAQGNNFVALTQQIQEETKETVLGESAKTVLKDAVAGAIIAKAVIDKTLDLSKEAISEAVVKIADNVNDIKDNVEDVAKAITDAIKTIDQEVTKAVDETINSAKEKVDETRIKVFGRLDEIIKGLQEVKKAVFDTIDEVKDIFEKNIEDNKDKSQSLSELVGKNIGYETLAKGQAESKIKLEEANKNTANQDSNSNENDNLQITNA